jgi:hypothetical protein
MTRNPNPNPQLQYQRLGSFNFTEPRQRSLRATRKRALKIEQTSHIPANKMAPQHNSKVDNEIRADNPQKRKLNGGDSNGPSDAVDTSRPSAVFKPTKGRTHTLSLALPGSIIAK